MPESAADDPLAVSPRQVDDPVLAGRYWEPGAERVADGQRRPACERLADRPAQRLLAAGRSVV